MTIKSLHYSKNTNPIAILPLRKRPYVWIRGSTKSPRQIWRHETAMRRLQLIIFRTDNNTEGNSRAPGPFYGGSGRKRSRLMIDLIVIHHSTTRLKPFLVKPGATICNRCFCRMSRESEHGKL